MQYLFFLKELQKFCGYPQNDFFKKKKFSTIAVLYDPIPANNRDDS